MVTTRASKRRVGLSGMLLLSGAIACSIHERTLHYESAEPIETGGTESGGSDGTGGTAELRCGDIVDPDPARAQSCVLAASCFPLGYSVSDCITYGLDSSCLLDALDCSDIEECLKMRYEDSSVCSAEDAGWHCEGDRAVYCDSEQTPYSVDCGARGATCVVPSGENALAGAAPCELTGITTCEDSADVYQCDGTLRYSCSGGHAYGGDCDASSQTCYVESDGNAWCTGSDTCSASEEGASCDDDELEFCSDAGRRYVWDCAVGGGSCEAAGTSSAYCLAPGCTTDDSDACQEGCADDFTLELCIGGARQELRCDDYGFDTCLEYEDEDTGDVIPYCDGRAELPCEDGCEYAGDGECDDGGVGADTSVCAYGTDCGDCGMRRCAPSEIGGECSLPGCGCGANERCYPASQALGMRCYPSDDDGLGEGEACSGPGSCEFGLGCFGGFCNRYCSTVSDCPAVEGQDCVHTTWAEDGSAIQGVDVCLYFAPTSGGSAGTGGLSSDLSAAGAGSGGASSGGASSGGAAP